MCGKVLVSLLVFCAFFLCIPFCICAAPLHLEITRGNAKKITVSLVQLHFSSNLERTIGDGCAHVVLQDLNSTGMFDAKADTSGDYGVLSNGIPSSDKWTSLKRDIFLTGSTQEFSPGRIKIKLYLWDVASGKQLSGKSFNFEVGSWRRAAHMIADHIYSRVTGDRGYFDTKIVYVSELDGDRKIAIMDQDGENNVYVTKEKHGLVFSPRFSADGKRIVYTLNSQSPRKIVVYDIEHGTDSQIIELAGVGSSAVFSPNGDSVLFSESKNGSTNVYSFGLEEKNVTQLTDNEFINVSASYSPDGKSVVFSSDRTGVPHLYVMNSDGSDQKKISSGSSKYLAPVWSPRGDWIAFVKIKNSGCSIGIMRPDGSKEKSLATGHLLDNPSWAPNGKAILFTKHEPRTEKNRSNASLVVVNMTGTYSRVIKTPGDPSSAHWSQIAQD